MIQKNRNEAGDRFRLQLKKLYVLQKDIAKILKTSKLTIIRWVQKGPSPSLNQIKAMIDLGINPLYPAGHGEIVLPEFTREEVEENIQRRIEELK